MSRLDNNLSPNATPHHHPNETTTAKDTAHHSVTFSDADGLRRGAREMPNSTIMVMNNAITNLANAAMKITISADNNFDPTKIGFGIDHSKSAAIIGGDHSPIRSSPSPKPIKSPPNESANEDQASSLPSSAAMKKQSVIVNDRRRNSLFMQFKNKIKDGFKNRGETNRSSSSSSSSENMSSGEDSDPNHNESTGDRDDTDAKKSKKGKKRHKSNKHSKMPIKDPFHDKQESLLILKQAYYSLLCAILDPTSHMREKHSFQFKTFNKLTTCDECKSILWGLNKQGLQCQKCFMNIHEKCQELIQEDCAQQRISKFEFLMARQVFWLD